MNPHNSPTLSAPAGDSGAGGATETGGALGETKTKIAETARETVAKVKTAASHTAERVKEEAERLASERRQTAADRIGDYSSAVHESARSLEEKDPNIAWFTHRAADKLQHVADYVRNRDLAELRTDVENVVRRHPAAFFGGLFLAGLVLGNVVKASRRKLDATSANDDYAGESDYDPDAPRAIGEDAAMSAELTAAERSAAGI